MPRFEPFAGLRYAPDRVVLEDVIAPPYDVIDDVQAAALAARSEYNCVAIEVPNGKYDRAAAVLDGWQRDGSLVADAPSFYVYRMSFRGEDGALRRTTGVIGALGIEDAGEGDVLPHEHTTPKAKSDRLQLLRATRTNTSPIWGLSMATGLSATLEIAGPADGGARDDDGVLHELWVVDDERQVKPIRDAVAAAPVVIADGHHRYETARAFRDEQRAAGRANNDDELVMALVVELSPEQLEVRAIHRLVSGLPPGFDLVGALAGAFDVTPTDVGDDEILGAMQEHGALALVSPAGRFLLTPLPATSAAADHDLDSSRLDVALARLPRHDLRFQHGVTEVVSAVAAGEADAAVLLRPATVAQITETGRSRLRMPPKTTFFWPKPRTGLVFRRLRG